MIRENPWPILLKILSKEWKPTDSGYGKHRATEAFAKDGPNFFLPSDRVGPQECRPAGRLQKLRSGLRIWGIRGMHIVGCLQEISGKLRGLLGGEM